MSAPRPTVDRTRAPEPLQPKAFRFPDVFRDSLPNGVRVRVARREQLPLVSAMLLLERGGTEDPTGSEGLSVMMSRMLSEGAGSRNASEVAEEADQLGLSLDHSSGWDSTVVRARMLEQNLEPGLALVADLALRPHFDPKEFEREREMRLAEIQSDLDDPRSIVIERSARFVYGQHRYGTSASGTDASIRALGTDTLQACHARTFVPSHASLIFVGRISNSEAMKLAEKFFGAWQGTSGERAPVADAPGVGPTRIHLVDRPGAAQSEIRLAQPGVARNHPDYFKLIVMNAVLGEAFGSRLAFNLREKNGFTYGASSGFQMRRGRGPFVAAASVATDVTDRALVEFMNEMRGIREIPPTHAELTDARGYLAGGLAVELQSNGSVAERISEAELFGLPNDHVDTFRSQVDAVSAEDAVDVARKFIDPERMVITVVGDAEKIRPGLEKVMGVDLYDVAGNRI